MPIDALRGVDDLDRAQPVERLGRDLRGLHRRRQLRREVDADDAVGAVVVQAAERLLERADRRCRGLGQHRRRLELAPELVGAQLLAVDVLAVAEADRERHDLDAELLAHLGRKVTGTVGHDANGHGSSSGPSSSAASVVRLRCAPHGYTSRSSVTPRRPAPTPSDRTSAPSSSASQRRPARAT